MDLSLQSTFPPGYVPPGIDTKSLDSATKSKIETTGLTVHAALGLIGVEPHEIAERRTSSLGSTLLSEPTKSSDSQINGTRQALNGLDSETVSVDIYSIMALFQRSAQEMRTQARQVRASELNAQVKTLMNAADEIDNAAKDRLHAARIEGWTQIAGGGLSIAVGAAGGYLGYKGAQASGKLPDEPAKVADVADDAAGALNKTASTGQAAANKVDDIADSTLDASKALDAGKTNAANRSSTAADNLDATKQAIAKDGSQVSQRADADEVAEEGIEALANANKASAEKKAADEKVVDTQADQAASMTSKQLEAAKTAAMVNSSTGYMLSGMAASVGQLPTGMGTVTAAPIEQEAAEHDAQRSRQEAAARVNEQSVQEANEQMQRMMDIINDVRDKLGAIDQARSETNRGIARNV